MAQGKINGYICQGFNPLQAFPNKEKIRTALGKLKFLVVMDPLETETSRFWENHGDVQPVRSGQDPDGGLPAADDLLRRGERQRWPTRRAGCNGTGRRPMRRARRRATSGSCPACSTRMRAMYRKDGGAFPDPILNLTWNYTNPVEPGPDELAKEMNGRALADMKDRRRRRAAARRASCSTASRSCATTARPRPAAGSTPAAAPRRGNQMARRDATDPREQGLAPNWAWSWPANRRILYNRASADPAGKPWNPREAADRSGTAATWTGIDVPDYAPTQQAGRRRRAVHHELPRAWRGCSRATRCAKGRSPSTTSRSRARSPNVLHPEGAGRIRRRGCSPTTAQMFGTAEKFPYVAHDLPTDRAFPLLDQARADQRDPAAGGVRRDRRGAGARRRASRRAIG